MSLSLPREMIKTHAPGSSTQESWNRNIFSGHRSTWRSNRNPFSKLNQTNLKWKPQFRTHTYTLHSIYHTPYTIT